MKKQTGITLIALVITIIVLLILAGLTVVTLTGDNGLITKSSAAKQASKEAEIRERIQLAVIAAGTNNSRELNKKSIEEELTKEFGENNYELIPVGEGFLIAVDNIEYLVDGNGYVNDGNKVEVSNIENAGDLSKGGQYDGTSEETAYKINCIEDLVEWSNNPSTYSNKNIKLENTIDFNSTASYKNARAKTTDINGNGKIEELITELTTGTGFKPISTYSGTFDGQNNEIKNIYENRKSDAGLFAGIPSSIIKRLTITGKIITTENAGAIANGGNNATIIDCNANCIIQAGKNAAGILVQAPAANSETSIYNCFTEGSIIGNEFAGGICAYLNGTNKIINCYNGSSVNGNIAGGILGRLSPGVIFTSDNCFNYGNLNGVDYTGGITGYSGTWRNPAGTVENAYYLETTAIYGYTYSPDPSNRVNKEYIQSQDFVNELNTYVNTYNEEHKNDEGFIQLKRWKYNEGSYPTFE